MSTDDAGRDFDWSEAHVVVPEQPATACYLNPAGGIVLRQQGAWPDNDDHWLWFAPEHAPAVAKAILEAAALSTMAPEPEPEQVGNAPKDPTAAERQRRRRARQKEEPTLDIARDSVTPPVTSRDGAEG